MSKKKDEEFANDMEAMINSLENREYFEKLFEEMKAEMVRFSIRRGSKPTQFGWKSFCDLIGSLIISGVIPNGKFPGGDK